MTAFEWVGLILIALLAAVGVNKTVQLLKARREWRNKQVARQMLGRFRRMCLKRDPADRLVLRRLADDIIAEANYRQFPLHQIGTSPKQLEEMCDRYLLDGKSRQALEKKLDYSHVRTNGRERNERPVDQLDQEVPDTLVVMAEPVKSPVQSPQKRVIIPQAPVLPPLIPGTELVLTTEAAPAETDELQLDRRDLRLRNWASPQRPQTETVAMAADNSARADEVQLDRRDLAKRDWVAEINQFIDETVAQMGVQGFELETEDQAPAPLDLDPGWNRRLINPTGQKPGPVSISAKKLR